MRWHVTVLSTFLFVTLHSSKSTLAQQTDNSRPSDIPASIAVTTSSPSPDLVLISPQDPNFDETERHLLGIAASGPALDLKPFLVILFNRSVGTVVAYEMVWKITHTDKTVEISSADVNYPDGVVAVPARASERPLMSGEQRLIGREFQLDPSWAEANVQDALLETIGDQQAEMPRIERLDISLDVAIFADGLALGPDTRGLTRRFTIYVNEERQLIHQVVSDLDAGRSIDEAFQTINRIKAQLPPTGPHRALSAFYRKQAGADLFGLRKRIGDAAVATAFRKANRAEPFVIRRGTT
jgi:hypothetical protein